ncbi:MAG TPA: N-acetylmuramoyl-L-alanine amidase, partial [Chitinophagaceae bacterium]|nr:N-acetylmuramoyl-L-alanine amidase [Chitinophagaceae bacterium]
GILYSYYHFALRNKVFHAWNRFYLLAMIPFSILLPLLDINIMAPADDGTRIVSALRIVAGADEYVLDTQQTSGISWSAELVSLSIYMLVSLAIAVIFTIGLVRLVKMIRKYQPVLLENFYFLNTVEPGTPFSFLSYLVWNQEIALNTENGRRILEHELVHIREKHSWDKIFIHITLIFFWINPFFWLARQEMTMIHEFIADRKSVGNGDTEAFAKLILASSFPSHTSLLTNSFFQSSIKRRLAMISKTNNPLVAYISRLMMIPVVFVMIFAFAVQSEPRSADKIPAVQPLGQKYIVVLDAGHGGEDAGAINGNLKEKELNLALAKMVKELNVNPDLELVLTRSSDQTTALADRVKLASDKNAQLFLSLHTASAPSADQKGITAFISGRDLTRHQENVRFASLLLNNLSSVYNVDKRIKQRENQGVWVLDKNVCPAVILECGYITNPEDRNYLSSKSNQEKIAKQILRSIEDYFSKTVLIQSAASVQVVNDTTPKTKTREKTPPAKVTFLYLNGTSETLTIREYRDRTGREDITFLTDTIKVNGNALPKKKTEESQSITEVVVEGNNNNNATTVGASADGLKEVVVMGYPKKKEDGNVKYFVDGKEVNSAVANSMNPENIASVNVTKNSNQNTVNIVSKNVDASNRKTVLTIPKSPPPLYILNGDEISEAEMNMIDPNNIASIDILKDKTAEKIYGEKAKNGVIVITLKKK